jgi:AraC-like DNA-binding protein
MYDLSNTHITRDNELLKNLAFSFIREIDYLNEPAEPEFILQAKRFIEKNIANNIELPDIAKASGLSISRFAHAFKKQTGIAPVEYLRRRRLEHARTLLLSTSLPIKEIAEKCGCTDQYIFSKTFKRIMGVPPGSPRK